MLTTERLLSFEKDDLQEASRTINKDDLQQLVNWLSEKDDTIRYHSFLLLQYRSKEFEDVYPFWDEFCEKLTSTNSYQRSIGLMLIAANAKWDKADKLDYVIDQYLLHLNDEKPITVRQCIQSLSEIVPYKRQLLIKIADRLMAINISNIRATMQKLILTDILTILAMIRKHQVNNEIEGYILNALSGGILDKKTIKHIEALL
jgi:hypothetical protein